MRRKVWALLFLAVLVAVIVSLIFCADNHKTIKLSELSIEEQLSFLQAQGIEGAEEHPDFVRSVIAHVEENPNHQILISNPLVCELGEQVKDAVNNYYQQNSDRSVIQYLKDLFD